MNKEQTANLHYFSCYFAEQHYFKGCISKEDYLKYIEDITDFILSMRVTVYISLDEVEDDIKKIIKNSENFKDV